MNSSKKFFSLLVCCGIAVLYPFPGQSADTAMIRFADFKVVPDSFVIENGGVLEVSGTSLITPFAAGEDTEVVIDPPVITANIAETRSGLIAAGLREIPLSADPELARSKQWFFAIAWDGRDDDGDIVGPGRYKMSVTALFHKKTKIWQKDAGGVSREVIVEEDVRSTTAVPIVVSQQ